MMEQLVTEDDYYNNNDVRHVSSTLYFYTRIETKPLTNSHSRCSFESSFDQQTNEELLW